MEWGPRAQGIARAALDAGRAVPASAIPPSLPDHLVPYLANPDGYFWQLSTDRPFGLSTVGPIPWSSKVRFARDLGLDKEAQDDFVYLISALDEVYLKIQAERQDKTNSKPATGRGK
jgi:hypothetical protein